MRFIALHIIRVRISPDVPTRQPDTTSTVLLIAKPANAAASPERAFRKEIITADSEEPKSIEHLRGLGLLRIKASKKGKDSINAGIQFIQDFKIFIHPRCVNFLTEISNYAWDKDKFGKAVNKPIDDFNHLMDAMRYALEDYMRNNRMKTINKNILGVR